MNPALARLLDKSNATAALIDDLTTRVSTEDRNFSDAELTLLESWKTDLKELERQRKPLEEVEQLRADHEAAAARISAAAPTQREARPAGLQITEPMPWRTAGEFVRDLVGSFPNGLNGGHVDQAMAGRIEGHTRATQATGDTAGLLPETIAGQVITDVDEARPFLTAIGVRPLTNVTGKVFNRPKITQHTDIGAQTEGQALPTQKMTIDAVAFTKTTRGGSLIITRQDLDWSDPSAWQIVLDDLAAMYAEDTDTVAAAALSTAVTQTTEQPSNDLDGIIAGLYDAAYAALTVAGTAPARTLRLPNVVLTSADAWKTVGTAIDKARAQVAPGTTGLGSGGIGTINGTVLDLPRIMVPGLPAETIIVGRTNFTEFYEQRIGLLQAVVPSTLGVEVAYGGYIAYGTLDATAFCKVTKYVA